MTIKTLNEYFKQSLASNKESIARLILIIGVGVLLCMSGCQKQDDPDALEVVNYPERQKDFSIWQLEQFNFEVQMCYIIRTDDDKITVVDGGMPTSFEKVTGYLQQFGGRVHTWVITHPHIDHIGVLQEVVKRKEIQIDRILHSKLNEEWSLKYESSMHSLVSNYNKELAQSGISVIDAKNGEIYALGDGVDLKIIGVKNDSITVNAINNFSLVFKIESKSKSVLFLGDLGVEGGKELLRTESPEVLKADYVQMSHHGQAGVGLEFYKAVDPDYALWPTPKWLWENSAEGQGPGTGNFQIPEVRSWMDNEVNVKKNYVAGLEGNIQID